MKEKIWNVVRLIWRLIVAPVVIVVIAIVSIVLLIIKVIRWVATGES